MKEAKINKNRLKRKGKTILFIGVFLFCYFFTIKISQEIDLQITNEEFLRYLIDSSNSYMPKKEEKETVATKVIAFLANVDLENPVTLISNNYIKTLSTSGGDSDLLEDLDKLAKTSKYINDPYSDKEIKEPLIYIYNTHQLENYSNNNLEIYNITPNVMMTSYILREKLANLGIEAMVEEANVTEILNANGWNYAASYDVTEMLIKDIKEKYPSIKYFIDVHRDSVGKGITTATISNVSYAKLMFLIGLENPTYAVNLTLATDLNNLLEQYYPGISRGIYQKKGKGVNGVYNQDLSNNAMLIEVGGVGNTIDEVYNSVTALTNVLANYIGAHHE